jgi:sugar phosphate isomerase/epimerase
MHIGVDSYSYHRLLGELRPGEPPPPGPPLARGALDLVAECRELGVDLCALETCFLPPPAELDVDALRAEAGGMELALSWGAPNGLEFGASAMALDDLLAWLELAPRLGTRLVRIVAAGPRLRGAEPVETQIARTVAPLRRAAEHAAGLGLELALENHGDLGAAELANLLARVDHDALGVCFDTANAPRVGDDAVEAAALLAPSIRMVHLKDVEPLERVADPVAGPRSVRYGEGTIDLHGVLAELPPGSPVCVEVAQLGPGDDERALVRSGVAWLQDWLKL